MLSHPSLQCTSGPPSYLNSTGGTSKEIVNLNSDFEKADRLLEQKRTGSQYEKVEQLHNLTIAKNQMKNVNGSVNSEGHLIKFKTRRDAYSGLRSIYLCHQKPNPAPHETVPLSRIQRSVRNKKNSDKKIRTLRLTI
jgi:hypothetical protein